ncbi:MAG TPA: hypothetical protein VFZ65_05210 [Planctomycetota bacterium]|nr:hypothetical protein [Planctomycetota bacterium]
MTTVQPYHDRRRELTRKEKDPVRRRRMLALAHFDKMTDPEVLWGMGDKPLPSGAKARDAGDAIDFLRNHLSFRTTRRAAAALRGQPFCLPAEDERWLEAAAIVEKHVRGLLEQGFLRQRDRAHVEFTEILGAFTCGEMTLTGATPKDDLASAGIPDGVQFFSFAEAALYFAAWNVNGKRAFWLGLLPTFVCMAEIFPSCYWNGRSRLESAYSNHFFRAGNTYWRELFATYEKRRPIFTIATFSVGVAAALRDRAEKPQFEPPTPPTGAAPEKPVPPKPGIPESFVLR